MNKIIKTILTLSILYWTMFYVINNNGFWLPIPFILIGLIWFYNFKRYEIKQNSNGEYYIFDNIFRNAKDLQRGTFWWYKNSECFKHCLTTNKELAEKHYNRLIS